MSATTPVMIGVGQAVDRIDAADYAALSAADLAANAAQHAIGDCRSMTLAASIDMIAAVRTFDDSIPRPAVIGKPDNFPRAIARRLGIAPTHALLGPAGGDTPLTLLGELATRIAAGDLRCALLAGGEAISTVRHMSKRGERRDWAEHDAGTLDDRGAQLDSFIRPWQVQHGVHAMPIGFGLLENARRARLGLSRSAYAQTMGDLFAPFTHVAAANRYAASAVSPLTAQDMIEPSSRNRMIADPYPQRLVARDQVNQGAAVIITSVGHARAMGVPEDRWVYLHALASAGDHDILARPDPGTSVAAQAVLRDALDATGMSTADIQHFDFYSCFPIAVFASAIDALKLAPNDSRGLTRTGALPFFGGAGNNYATHALAELVTRCRSQPGTAGLQFALGGYLSKCAAAIVSTRPPDEPFVLQPCAMDPASAVTDPPTGRARMVTSTVIYDAGEPVRAVAIGETENGGRFAASTSDGDVIRSLLAEQGSPGAMTVSADASGAGFALDG